MTRANSTTANIYVDGVDVTDPASINTTLTLTNNTSPLAIGSDQASGTVNYFKGQIDEVALYKSILTGEGGGALHRRHQRVRLHDDPVPVGRPDRNNGGRGDHLP